MQEGWTRHKLLLDPNGGSTSAHPGDCNGMDRNEPYVFLLGGAPSRARVEHVLNKQVDDWFPKDCSPRILSANLSNLRALIASGVTHITCD